MTTISNSYLQKFANGALDACEHYFMGKRVPHKKDEEKWWATALRVSSWFTVVLPLGFAATFVLAKALQRPDNSMKKYWKQRVHVAYASSHSKKFYLNLLIRSGITQTQFEHIYILQLGVRNLRNQRIFAGDGHFSCVFARTFDERKKMLALRVSPDKITQLARYRYNQLDINSMPEADQVHPSTARVISGTDHNIISLFHKIPNQMKAILQTAPDFINDVEPDASHLDGQAT